MYTHVLPFSTFVIIQPQLNQFHDEQDESKSFFSPSKMIKILGEKIDNKESVLYWAAKNDIPVFCPALTDGKHYFLSKSN